MRSLTCLLPYITLSLASVLLEQSPFEYGQGFDLDLNALRLVELEGLPPVWMTEREKIEAKSQGLNFFDITDTPDLEGSAPVTISKNRQFTLSESPAMKSNVRAAFEHLSTDSMETHLRKFSDFRTRYYLSSTGKESQKWLMGTITDIIDKYASSDLRSTIEITEFPHRWGQNSIITRIKGALPDSEGVVILSAHQDSTNMIPFLAAPGADDDGSGTVTILEAYKALLSQDFRPNHTMEFHWYSGEEGGLLGSQAVAKDYASRGAAVHAQLQFDMTAWVKKGTTESVGIGADPGVDESLAAFHRKLVEEYIDLPWVDTKCGYACSDHGSWGKAGYPNSFASEGRFEDSNPHIHSADDRIDISDEFSFDHMLQLGKLAVAYSAEVAGWV